MNGILGTGLLFWQAIVLILTIVAGFVVVRISLKFDLNKYLEHRQKLNHQKIRNACPHMELAPSDDGKIAVRSFFVSPPGTMQWQCQKCGLIKYATAEDEHERLANYYVENIDVYNKKMKKFSKLLKKSGQI